MSNLEKILNHVSFLGYQSEEYSEESGYTYHFITHKKNSSTIELYVLGEEIIYFRYVLELSNIIQDEEDFLNVLNDLNGDTLVSKVFYRPSHDDGTASILTIEGSFIGKYSKERFSLFFNLFSNDIENVTQAEKLKRFFDDPI